MQHQQQREQLFLAKQIPTTKILGDNESRTRDGKQYRTGYKFEKNSEGAGEALEHLERLTNPTHLASEVRREVYVIILGKIVGDRVSSMEKVLSRSELQAMAGQKPNPKSKMTSASA